MKINFANNQDYIEAYTAKNKENNFPKPNKEHFLVLRLHNNLTTKKFLDENPILARLGIFDISSDSSGTITITITGNRRIAMAFELLKEYGFKNNNLTKLGKQLEPCIQSASKKSPQIPPRGQDIANYEILKEADIKSFSHPVQEIRHKQTGHKEIYKSFDSGRSITEIEAFNSLCYRILLNEQTPIVKSIHDASGKRLGVISRKIEAFESLHDYYDKHNGSPPQQDLIKAGLGKILAAAYCEEENDLHGGQIGYFAGNTYKIDHDRSTWPITANYVGYDSASEHPSEAFPITDKDITTFPHLVDVRPEHFPHQADDGILNLEEIENNKDFLIDVYSTFLKRLLIPKQIYQKFAEATVGNKKIGNHLSDHKAQRTALFRSVLLKNEKFITFFNENSKEIMSKILFEFKEYNRITQLEESNPHFLLNIAEIENELSQIAKEINAEQSQRNHTMQNKFEDTQQPEIAASTPPEQVQQQDNSTPVIAATLVQSPQNENPIAPEDPQEIQPAATVVPIMQAVEADQQEKKPANEQQPPISNEQTNATIVAQQNQGTESGEEGDEDDDKNSVEVHPLTTPVQQPSNAAPQVTSAPNNNRADDPWLTLKNKLGFEYNQQPIEQFMQHMAKPKKQAAEKTIDKDKALNAIFSRLLLLDNSVGILGGVYKGVDKKLILLPKAAAAIFDYYADYTMGDSSANDALDRIIETAQIATKNKGHTLFNKRQDEASKFYNFIVDLGKAIQPEEQMDPNASVLFKQ